MPKTDKPVKALRYRSYFWLMDIATPAVIMTVGLPALDSLTGIDVRSVMPPPVWFVLNAFALIFGLCLPTFLMCARFLRDDYVEALWRRSVAVLAYVMAITPIAALSINWILYLALGQPERVPDFLRWAFAKVEIYSVILNVSGFYIMIFVAIFQFLRWRDTR
jgi:cytochrome bd-type quinol oxidase subunit 1